MHQIPFDYHWEHGEYIPNIGKYFDAQEEVKSASISTIFPVNINKVPVKVVNKSDNALPAYAHEIGDSGMDVRAFISKESPNRQTFVYPKEVQTIHTGLYVHIPYGHEIQIRPRSGMGKIKVNLANCVGTIDANYRGEIMLLIYNFGEDRFLIENGDRVAQLVIAPVHHIVWNEVETLEDSNRSTGGFGHTGIK